MLCLQVLGNLLPRPAACAELLALSLEVCREYVRSWPSDLVGSSKVFEVRGLGSLNVAGALFLT